MTGGFEHGPGDSFIERLSRAVGAGVDPEVELEAGGSRGRDAVQSSGSGTSAVVARMQERPVLYSRYRLEAEIARGGTGAIREFWDKDLRRRLAMKVALGRGEEGLSLHVVFMLISMLHNHRREVHAEILRDLRQIVETGGLKPVLYESRYPLEEAGQAHARLDSGQAMGQVVVEN